jgi:hypothetical protein
VPETTDSQLIVVWRPYQLLRPAQLVPFVPERRALSEALSELAESEAESRRRMRWGWADSDLWNLDLGRPVWLGLFAAIWDSLRLITVDVPEHAYSTAATFSIGPDGRLDRSRPKETFPVGPRYLDSLRFSLRALSAEEADWWLRIGSPRRPLHALGARWGGPSDRERLYTELAVFTRTLEIDGQEGSTRPSRWNGDPALSLGPSQSWRK